MNINDWQPIETAPRDGSHIPEEQLAVYQAAVKVVETLKFFRGTNHAALSHPEWENYKEAKEDLKAGARCRKGAEFMNIEELKKTLKMQGAITKELKTYIIKIAEDNEKLKAENQRHITEIALLRKAIECVLNSVDLSHISDLSHMGSMLSILAITNPIVEKQLVWQAAVELAESVGYEEGLNDYGELCDVAVFNDRLLKTYKAAKEALEAGKEKT